MSEYLPYDDIKFDKNIKLKDKLNTPDDSDIGYLIEVDLKYLEKIKYKTKKTPFATGNKKITLDDFCESVNI